MRASQMAAEPALYTCFQALRLLLPCPAEPCLLPPLMRHASCVFRPPLGWGSQSSWLSPANRGSMPTASATFAPT